MTAEFSKKTKYLVRERAQDRCELWMLGVCTWRIDHFHHRRPRASGGTRSLDSAHATNCLALCAACHDWAERRNRKLATEFGVLVIQTHNPFAVPVRRGRGWFLLHENAAFQVWPLEDCWYAKSDECPPWANPAGDHGEIDVTEALEAHRLRRVA